MGMFLRRGLGALSLLGLLTAPVVSSGQSPRYVSLIEARVDGEPAVDSSAETAFVQAMLGGGAVFVDEAQSRKIRSVTSAGRLLQGGVSSVITSLDADLLLVALVQVDTFDSRILKNRAVRMEATLQAKLIEVATGRVLYAGRHRAKGLHFTKSEATRLAARGAAKKLASVLLARAPSVRPLTVELSIQGPLAMSQLQSVRAEIVDLPGVIEVSVLSAGEVCKLALQIEPRVRIEDLALSMDTVFEVSGFDRSTISAKLRSATKPRKSPAPPSRRVKPRLPVAPGSTPRVFGVRVPDTEIYPALQPRYEREAGTLNLMYRGSEPLSRALVSVTLQGLTLVPTVLQVASLSPGSSHSLPFGLVLSVDALAGLQGATQQVLRIQIQFGNHTEVHELGVHVHSKNALHWQTPKSLAAFVTHESAQIRNLASQALGRLKSDSALGAPAVLFEVLRGLRYQQDPVHPGGGPQLDSVKFPAETLNSGFGDCEDLSVLLAALAESVGIQSAFVLTQDHVLVLLDTGVAVQGAVTLGVDASRFVVLRGRLWIPIETTDLGTFAHAWQAGLRSTNKESRQIFETREAWQVYPPVDLGGSISTRALSAKVIDAIELLNAQGQAAQTQALAASSVKRRGLLLAGARRYAEAEAVFGEAATPADNNRANLEVLRLRPEAALAQYEELLSTGAQDLRVSLNAALAAWMSGTRQVAFEYMSDAMDAAEESGQHALVERFITQLNRPPAAKGTARTEQERLAGLTFWL